MLPGGAASPEPERNTQTALTSGNQISHPGENGTTSGNGNSEFSTVKSRIQFVLFVVRVFEDQDETFYSVFSLVSPSAVNITTKSFDALIQYELQRWLAVHSSHTE